jgi:GNAT superfamily N-acetyltransferase
MSVSIQFVQCNFNDPIHLENLITLINEYILDDMGGGIPITGLQKLRLVDGLNSHPATYIVFALANDDFVGLAICFELFSTFNVRKCINIHDFIVRKEFRRKKIGTALMMHIHEYAISKGCSSITLEVRHDNTAAQMLYIEEGFKPCEPNMLFWKKIL